MISVAEAQKRQVCRICEQPVNVPPDGKAIGWMIRFFEMTHPVALTLDFGAEFAHTGCLEGLKRSEGELETRPL